MEVEKVAVAEWCKALLLRLKPKIRAVVGPRLGKLKYLRIIRLSARKRRKKLKFGLILSGSVSVAFEISTILIVQRAIIMSGAKYVLLLKRAVGNKGQLWLETVEVRFEFDPL